MTKPDPALAVSEHAIQRFEERFLQPRGQKMRRQDIRRYLERGVRKAMKKGSVRRYRDLDIAKHGQCHILVNLCDGTIVTCWTSQEVACWRAEGIKPDDQA